MRMWTTTLRDLLILTLTCGVVPLWVAVQLVETVRGAGLE